MIRGVDIRVIRWVVFALLLLAVRSLTVGIFLWLRLSRLVIIAVATVIRWPLSL